MKLENFQIKGIDLPIKLAAIPVGPRRSIFGFIGSVPVLDKILSACLANTLMRKLFPTPPPPKINKTFA